MVNFYFIKHIMRKTKDPVKKSIILNNYSKRVLKELKETKDRKKQEKIIDKYINHYDDLACTFKFYMDYPYDPYWEKIMEFHTLSESEKMRIDEGFGFDYFNYFKIERIEGIGYSLKAIDAINSDLEKYHKYMINKYNNDESRASDGFCFKKFLEDYSVAINVFGLHEELNCKGSFNRFINYCYEEINFYSKLVVGFDEQYLN